MTISEANKIQNSFICWKKQTWKHKNLLNIKSSSVPSCWKRDKNVEFTESLNQHKNKLFQLSLFSWQSWLPPVTFPQKKSCFWEKSLKKASAYCMRKKPCGLVDRLNTCECQSTLPSHKLLLLLVHAEYDFLHRGGDQSPSPCRLDGQLCMSNSVTFL